MKKVILSALILLASNFIFANEAKPKEDFFTSIATNQHEKGTHFQIENINPPILPATPVFTFDNKSEFTALKKNRE